MSEWQPIQTAPVGIPILVWGPEDEFAVAEYEGRNKEDTWDAVTGERLGDRRCLLTYYVEGGGDTYPTHWMPLPEPPK